MQVQVRRDECERAEHERAFQKHGDQHDPRPRLAPYVSDAGDELAEREAVRGYAVGHLVAL